MAVRNNMYKCIFEKYIYATKEEPTKIIKDNRLAKTWKSVFHDGDRHPR
jgi:hypothetical protein